MQHEPSRPETNLTYLLAETIAAADPELQERIHSDPEAYLDLIVLTDRTRKEASALLDAAVTSARSAGLSWDAIGESLGMSRQAAQQRFGPRDPQGEPPSRMSETRTLRGLTAFNEMAALNRAGKFGWHSVENGILFHTLERSTEQWEHDRVLITNPKRAQMERDGWQQAGEKWFPWVYYARPTGLPAIMEDVSDSYLIGG